MLMRISNNNNDTRLTALADNLRKLVSDRSKILDFNEVRDDTAAAVIVKLLPDWKQPFKTCSSDL